MMSFRVGLGAVVALVLAAPAMAVDDAFRQALQLERARMPAPPFERSAFLATAVLSSVALAPDGAHLAWLRGADDRRSLWMSRTDGGAPRELLKATDATSLLWSHDSQWLFIVSPSRLLAIPTSAGLAARAVTDLGGATQREVMDVDPTQAASVIVREARRDAAGRVAAWQLSRMSMDASSARLADAPDRITGFSLAADGALAYLQVVNASSLLNQRVASDGSRSEAFRCTEMHRCALWPRLDNEGRLIFLGDLGGTLRALQRREDDGAITTLAIDPRREADVDELAADAVSGLPAIATYRATDVDSRGIDVATQQHVDRIRSRFPGKALGFQPGQRKWLVTERGGGMQGARYHLYDPATGVMTDAPDGPAVSARAGRPVAWLPESGMATQLPFDWTASDGMRLHGFVRVPPGKDSARLPVVALIHGGPWGNVAANEFGTGVAQLLVNRGYVVFEPNFRGSTGYGRDYMLAARGDFGNGRVQKDITEGVRALLSEGVGDARRVGIVGASFGGYSTLLGLTWQPELFRVGVAFVPPSDFAWDLTWIGRTTEAAKLSTLLPFEQWMTLVGMDPHDAPHMDRLHREAPLANAERMNRPLLIIAGGQDQRVALRGVLGYVAQLRRLRKDVSLWVDPVSGHSDARPLAKEAGIYLMADMLHRYLGGEPDTPPDAELADYMKSTRM